jgi:hypothetical protein
VSEVERNFKINTGYSFFSFNLLLVIMSNLPTGQKWTKAMDDRLLAVAKEYIDNGKAPAWSAIAGLLSSECLSPTSILFLC